jgi:hypothetical protein
MTVWVSRRRALAALSSAVASALALTACSDAAPGTPDPAPAEAAAGVVDEVDITTPTGHDNPVVVAAADGAGGVAAVVYTQGEDRTHELVRVRADGDGLADPAVVEVPQARFVDDLQATSDGHVLIIGVVAPPDGGDPSFGLLVVDPATGGGPVHDLLPADGERSEDVTSALSSGQDTLYAAVLVSSDGGTVLRLLAVDVATGAIAAGRDLADVLPAADPVAVAVAEDGTVALVARLFEEPDDPDGSRLVLTRFGADLAPQGDPVLLSPPAHQQRFGGIATTDDGGVLVHVGDYYAARLISVAAGSDEAAVVLETEEGISDLAVAPDGAWVYVLGPGLEPVPVDLETGELGEPVDLCGERKQMTELLPAGRDGSLIVQGSCSTGEQNPPELVWKILPAR